MRGYILICPKLIVNVLLYTQNNTLGHPIFGRFLSSYNALVNNDNYVQWYQNNDVINYVQTRRIN